MSSLTLPVRPLTTHLHRAQANFLLSPALYKGFVGGRGAGKTWIGAQDMLVRAQSDRTYLIASPTSVLMQDTTFPEFKRQAEDLGVWDSGRVRLSPYPTVSLTTGARIRFRTAEDPERMRGPNLSGVWLDEASLMPKDAYLISIAALREAGQQGWLSATFTPRGLSHWTYEIFGQDTPDTAIFHAPTMANPFLPPDFHHRLEIQYGVDGLRAQQELDGRFVNVAGAEWPDTYFPEEIWFDRFPDGTFVATALALDPSKGKDVHRHQEGREPDYSAFCWGGVDMAGTVWIDADLDNVRDITRMVHDGIGIYRTFAPAAFVIEINVFQELLAGEFLRAAKESHQPHLPLYGITNTESKETRIRTIGPHLAKRELRFRDTKGCRLLVQQLRDFPAGAYDDGPDALSMLLKMLRYLISGHAEGPGQPRVLRA
jgi:predicted phage terminase large subunit-like protein